MKTIEYIDQKGKRVFGYYMGKSKDGLTAYVRRMDEKRNHPIHWDHIVESYRLELDVEHGNA